MKKRDPRIVQTPTGSWKFRVMIDHKLYPQQTFPDYQQAEAALRKLEEDVKAKSWIDPRSILTVGELCDTWINSIISNSKDGMGHRRSSIRQWQAHIAHINFSFENRKCDEMSHPPLLTEAFDAWEKPRKEGGRGLSRVTALKVRTTLSRILDFGIESRSGVRINIVRSLRPKKLTSGLKDANRETIRFAHIAPVTEKEVLTKKELKASILAASGDIRFYMKCGAYFGGRIGEVLSMINENILDNGFVFIDSSLSTAKIKGQENPVFELYDPKTLRGIREAEILDKDFIDELKEIKKGKDPKAYLFANSDGSPYRNYSRINKLVKKAVRRAGIDKTISSHNLRHTYASLLIDLGVPIDKVSKYMGHSDINITARRYQHFVEAKKREEKKNTLADRFERYGEQED